MKSLNYDEFIIGKNRSHVGSGFDPLPITAPLFDWQGHVVKWAVRNGRAAARYAGYRTAKAFRAWARAVGIKPSVDEKCNFWSRADIAKARERSKR